MHKRILYILLGTLVCTYAYAQSFCHLVTPVGTSYTDTITTPGTYYYSAQTADLPMDLNFISTDPTCSTPPELWFDLTCTPGVYTDPNILELIQDTAKYGISVPMRLNCETQWVDSLGAYVHHLKLGKSYRNKLKLVGVDYDVAAYVKVVVTCGGVAQIEQDTSSQACLNEARRISIQDETRVLANDSLTTYLLQYKEWLTQADSVALHWEGPDSVIVWIGTNDCEFIPDVIHAWDFYEIPPYGDYHLSRKTMENALKDKQDTTGYFFAKIFSAEEGFFSTHPLVPETKGATMLHYDTTQVVHVEDKDAFFCFPKDWTGIEWVADTRRVVKMFLHTSPELAPVDSFYYDLPDTTIRRVLVWSNPEMNLIRPYADGQLLFVRFECSGDFKFTPYKPDASSCVNKAIRIHSGVPYTCVKENIYSLYYADWKDYTMEIEWEAPASNILQQLFIADTCTFELNWNLTSTKNRCVYYKKTPRGGYSGTIDSADIAGWEPRVTQDGYFYVRMTAGGTITFTNNRPAPQDPDDGLPLDPPHVDPDPGPATGIDQEEVVSPYQKILHNGQILIIREGKAYTITGQTVKIE